MGLVPNLEFTKTNTRSTPFSLMLDLSNIRSGVMLLKSNF